MFRSSHNWLTRLRKDDSGAVDLAAYLLLATILGLGILVGLATYRDQVVQQYGDVAISLESLDQSYSFTIGDEEHSFVDENTSSIEDPEGESPAGIDLSIPPIQEGE